MHPFASAQNRPFVAARRPGGGAAGVLQRSKARPRRRTQPPADPAKPCGHPAEPRRRGAEAAGHGRHGRSCWKPGALPEKVLGKADAPVTIVEYASMTCPHCAHFHETTLPELKTKYIDTGKARLIFREFPFDPRAEAGFMLARCSNDNYFPMVDVLFKQQENWAGVENAKEALLQISKLAGFSQESFEACLTDQKLLEDVRAVPKRGSKEFRVEFDAHLLHQRQHIYGGPVD